MSNNPTSDVPTELIQRDVPLPERYQRAKKHLAECERVDECKDWSDKAKALSAYAQQAEDDELFNMARRIRARAIRRTGELLKEFQSSGGRPSNDYLCMDCDQWFSKTLWHCPNCGAHYPEDLYEKNPDVVECGDCHERFSRSEVTFTKLVESEETRNGSVPSSQREAAEQAGMSKRQERTARRVSEIPEDEFEQQVESDDPPSVTKLAEHGKEGLRENPSADNFDPEDTNFDQADFETFSLRSWVNHFFKVRERVDLENVFEKLRPDDAEAWYQACTEISHYFDDVAHKTRREFDLDEVRRDEKEGS